VNKAQYKQLVAGSDRGSGTRLDQLRLQAEDHAEELFIVYSDDSILVRIVLPEGGSQRVEHNAALNEVVKQYCSAAIAVKLAEHESDDVVTQPVAERCQCSCQL